MFVYFVSLYHGDVIARMQHQIIGYNSDRHLTNTAPAQAERSGQYPFTALVAVRGWISVRESAVARPARRL